MTRTDMLRARRALRVYGPLILVGALVITFALQVAPLLVVLP